jgi:hypothetical protein
MLIVVVITVATSPTLSEAMASLLSSQLGREVSYEEVPPPPSPDMEALWLFLRSGGFDVSTSTVKDVTGVEPQDFATFLRSLDFSDDASARANRRDSLTASLE